MPIDSLLVSIAVCGMFLVFAVVLALVDRRTTQWQRSKLAGTPTATVESRNKKAA
jgi:hypothetical protein